MARGWLVLGLGGCGAATVRFDDAQPGIDPGSGPGAGEYRVVVEARGALGTGDTEVLVTALDRDGAELDDAVVEVNGQELAPGPAGTWEGVLAGYDPRVELDLDGPAGRFHASAVGPEPHLLEAEPGPWYQPDPVHVSWTPYGASHAAIEATGPGRTDLRQDKGEYTIDGDTLDLYAIAVAVERWERLQLTGAAKGSSFLVSYAADLHRTVVGPEL